ncbi:phage virion morphogenesis protein [Candidatus Thiothrix sp. Deng01]|uniref:Phage virion morphogenesis protein n=1 Tax=Candidatus Thiothrix phosphatis TaxID=3112415 RepID=A0ABU6CX23_9GAMM|nr:phage virion morphogenesis protein [Candidatus Thiothrix sp. Deng01]MEB4591385.1 phage virion morphogenesis protein [Candidatus Thiothrix sp. Deng01]
MLVITPAGMASVLRQLQALSLPPGKLKQIHRALARKVASNTRKHARQQRTPDGGGWKPRAAPNPLYDDGKNRGRMMRRITRAAHMDAVGNAGEGKVYWANGWLGSVAKRQQEGARINLASERSRKGRKRAGADGWGNDRATRVQAMRLVSLGFQRRARGKGRQQASAAWIRKNLTINQAGLIIRILQPDAGKRKNSSVLPARPFLGVSPQENAELRQLLTELIIRYGD